MSSKMIRWGGPAAMLGGVAYMATWGAVYLIYDLFAEEAKGTFFGSHAFTHMVDVPAFALLALGAAGVYARQKHLLGKVGKAGFFLTLVGFGLSVVGGLTLIAVGLAVSDEATLGILDVVTHPLAHLLYAIGSLVFGIATFRAGVLPRWGALLAAVGPVWLFAMFMLGFGNGQSIVPVLPPIVAVGLGWMWLGYTLRKETHPVASSTVEAAAR